MFYLHWLIGLISPRKYWRVAKDSATGLKGVIQVKFYLNIILTKIQTTEERLNFLKTSKPRFRENFDFRGLKFYPLELVHLSLLRYWILPKKIK